MYFNNSNAYLIIASFNNTCLLLRGNLKLKYDVICTNWVDVDSIIFIVTMNYKKEKNIY
jgi:hypothetical protein